MRKLWNEIMKWKIETKILYQDNGQLLVTTVLKLKENTQFLPQCKIFYIGLIHIAINKLLCMHENKSGQAS